MYDLKAAISQYQDMTFGIDIELYHTELNFNDEAGEVFFTDTLVECRAFEMQEGIRFTTDSELKASLLCDKINHALIAGTDITYLQDEDAGARVFDLEIQQAYAALY